MFKNKRKIIFEARKKEDPTIPYRQRIQEIEQNYKAVGSEQKHYTNLKDMIQRKYDLQSYFRSDSTKNLLNLSKRYKEDASNIGVQREIGQNTLGLNKLSNSINEYKQLLQSIESLPEEDKKYFENKDGEKELDIKIKEYDNKLKDIGNEAVKAKQAILQIEDENR